MSFLEFASPFHFSVLEFFSRGFDVKLNKFHRKASSEKELLKILGCSRKWDFTKV